MPRPNLSELFSKFIYREVLTNDDKTAIRGDIGAEAAGAAAAAQAASQPASAALTALAVAGNSGVLAATTASFLAADRSKLDGIDAGAQVNVPVLALASIPIGIFVVNVTGELLDDVGAPLVFPSMSAPEGFANASAASGSLNYFCSGGPGAWDLAKITSGAYRGQWTSTEMVADPADVITWTAEIGSGTPVVATVAPNAIPTTPGQLAIVTHSDGTFSEWGAVSIALGRWLPRTAGILRKPDTGAWWRAFIAADGTTEYELLPNQ